MTRKHYSEKVIEDLFNLGIKYLGGLSYKFLSSQSKGNPDRIAILPGGIVFFMEAKSTGKKLSPTQLIKVGEIKARGGVVYVCDDYDSLLECLMSCNMQMFVSGQLVADPDRFDKLITKLRNG